MPGERDVACADRQVGRQGPLNRGLLGEETRSASQRLLQIHVSWRCRLGDPRDLGGGRLEPGGDRRRTRPERLDCALLAPEVRLSDGSSRAPSQSERLGTEVRDVRVPQARHHGVRAGEPRLYRCKRCRAEAVAKRRRIVKQKLVEEAGGACTICGYAQVPAALQFHHIDPDGKEFHIAHRGHSRSLARCRKEIRKCILLCANCHAAVESGAVEIPLELTTQGGLSEVA